MKEAAPGTYYRRMCRQNGAPVPLNAGLDQDAYHRTGRALLELCSDLETVFRFIEPVEKDHAHTYGSALKRLLFAACSEVETNWAGILNANGYPQATWTTKDYVKLNEAMGLDSYEVRLADTHWAVLNPFGSWRDADPTKSISWYDAYNKVKHDNQMNAHMATLRHAIEACAAVYIQALAQFDMAPFWPDGRYYQRVLQLERCHEPKSNEVYRSDAINGKWVAVPYFI
jgi:hypothetical protein